jgi:hypothetical protein
MSQEIPGDIPVIGTKATVSGGDETITIDSGGPNHRTLKVKTHGKRLRIVVVSEGKTHTVPVDKNDWQLRIEENV